MKKVGLLTFHASYNCGSMMQTYALQTSIERRKAVCEVIDFSNTGQQALYSTLQPNSSLKNIIKNIILLPHKNRIQQNYDGYETFKRTYFHLSAQQYELADQLNDKDYDAVIAGSDQIWNVTIEDGDPAYFLPWVKTAKKIAYAPSFGAKSLQKYANNVDMYKHYLEAFDMLSIREKNGQRWLHEMLGRKVPVLLDPTLLLQSEDYDKIAMKDLPLPDKYIFFYAPGYSKEITTLVKQVSEKYGLPVIAFNTKTFFVKGMWRKGFHLPKIETPASYLQLIKNAEIVFTTSFHGTIFSSIYHKAFWTIKNGGMFGDDDRVKTLVEQLGLEERVIPASFDENWNYCQVPDYRIYEKNLALLREKSNQYLDNALL